MIMEGTQQNEEWHLTVKITSEQEYSFEMIKEFTCLGVEIEMMERKVKR